MRVAVTDAWLNGGLIPAADETLREGGKVYTSSATPQPIFWPGWSLFHSFVASMPVADLLEIEVRLLTL